jgi:hypothetical protein
MSKFSLMEIRYFSDGAIASQLGRHPEKQEFGAKSALFFGVTDRFCEPVATCATVSALLATGGAMRETMRA